MRGCARISVIHEDRFRDEMALAGAATVSVWANRSGDTYAPHAHAYRKVLCCLDGSIVFHLPDGDASLGAGDQLEIAPHTRHSASVGSAGVRCAEAHFD
jgi:quercetin dioxygenase-like cupin family protein